MEDMGAFSKNYSRIKIIQHLEALSGDTGARAAPSPDAAGPCAPAGPGSVELAFVDESQDLASVDLKALKLMCPGAAWHQERQHP